MNSDSPSPQNSNAIPLAIVAAGVLVAGAVLYSAGGLTLGKNTPAAAPVAATPASERVRPVDASDHILGSPNAKITIIEFSDTECPFCKDFHAVLHQAMNTYGKNGDVAWVYRHFPIPPLHPKAQREAEATECAAELGGNTAFWAYLDGIFQITPSNNGLDPNLLPEIAKKIGLDVTRFNECLASGRYTKRVLADAANAAETGGEGTPHSIIVTKDGHYFPILGFVPFDTLDRTITIILQNIK
jgi:protein-disulfide isomerase